MNTRESRNRRGRVDQYFVLLSSHASLARTNTTSQTNFMLSAFIKMATDNLVTSSTVVLTPRLDDIGNLILRVGLDDNGAPKKSFLVSSHAMCLASPVWHAMFNPNGHFRESHERDIPFLDDDPDPFEIALLIAHAQFSKVPTNVTLGVFVKLAVLANKYDLVPLLIPFTASWAKILTTDRPVLLDGWIAEHQLFTAHVFGLKEAGQEALKHLCLHTTVDEAGDLIWRIGYHGENKSDRKINKLFLPNGVPGK
jgi:hypothetical protein